MDRSHQTISKVQDGIVFLDGTTCKSAKLEILAASPTESRASITISEGQISSSQEDVSISWCQGDCLKRSPVRRFYINSELSEGNTVP